MCGYLTKVAIASNCIKSHSKTEEEKEAAKAEKERLEQELQQLYDDQTVLNRESARNQRMREVRGVRGLGVYAQILVQV